MVSHNAMLQAISYVFALFSLTLCFVLFDPLTVKKAKLNIYNINKFLVSCGDGGRSFPCFLISTQRWAGD